MSSRFALFVVLLAIVIAPLSLRALNRVVLGTVPDAGYLPSLDLRRSHRAFNPVPLEDLKYGQPRWVFIGDSMLGTRIDPRYLGEIATTGDELVAFLYHPATGPAWWYLTFKNNLIASGVKPRCVFFFFRDTNMTDTMFRLESLYGTTLDEVASTSEPDLDRIVAMRRRGVWARAYRGLNRLYEFDVATTWMEPKVRRWFVSWKMPDDQARRAFEYSVEETFALEHLRRDVSSDLAEAEVPDFQRDLPSSVLPLIMDLAKRHGVPVCFVRVQRRPVNGRPPEQPQALVKYVAEFRAWAEANGAFFHDDTGDPEMTEDLYEDGDHFGNRRRYTEIFRKRLDPLFRAEPVADASGAEGR